MTNHKERRYYRRLFYVASRSRRSDDCYGRCVARTPDAWREGWVWAKWMGEVGFAHKVWKRNMGEIGVGGSFRP